MSFGQICSAPTAVRLRTALFELSKQVLPFVPKLTRRNGYRLGAPERTDFARIKSKTPGGCLGMNLGEKAIHRRYRQWMSTKSLQLRMMLIPASLASKYGPCQQSFTPKRNQAPGVQIARMKGPEAHDRSDA